MGPRLSTTNWTRLALYRVPAPAATVASAPRLVKATKVTKTPADTAARAARFAKWAASGKVAA